MSEAAIQTAVLNRLTSFTALIDLLEGAPYVYDYVPQPKRPEDNSHFPYVTIGDDTHLSWDTDDTDGLETEINIHTWSRYKGRMRVKEIQKQIYNALHHHELLVDDAKVVLLHFVRSIAGPDVEIDTQHGVQVFRLLLDNR